MVRHGGALGIGLSAMGTNRMDIYDQLKFNLYQDDAVTGEAASLAMGLLMIGSKSDTAITDMISVSVSIAREILLPPLTFNYIRRTYVFDVDNSHYLYRLV